MHITTIQNTARAMVCAILLGFFGAVSADEIPEPGSVAEELLEILLATGTIDDTRFQLDFRAFRPGRARAHPPPRVPGRKMSPNRHINDRNRPLGAARFSAIRH